MPYIMLHTLSHLLLTAVSLECGYPASSLRERVYASKKGYGILIYTATADAEGTRTWEWAGRFRTTDKSIGVPTRQVWTTLRDCVDDARYWTEHGTMGLREAAAHFHQGEPSLTGIGVRAGHDHS
jgi:hypothetical protein